MDNDIITIQLTRDQLELISKACEVVSRLHMNQFDVLKDVCHREDQPYPDYYDFRDIELQLKQMFSPELGGNSYWGIFNCQISDEARELWDIHQSIRYELSWENNLLGGMTVNYDKPFHSSDKPLPVIVFSDPNVATYLSFFRRLNHSINQMVRKSGWNEDKIQQWIQLCKEFALHENDYIYKHDKRLPDEEYNNFFNLIIEGEYLIWNENYTCDIVNGKLVRNANEKL